MTLTDLVVNGLPRGATLKTIKKYFEKDDILVKWNKSTWAKRLDNRARRAALTDFDRFKLLKLKKQVCDLYIDKYIHHLIYLYMHFNNHSFYQK